MSHSPCSEPPSLVQLIDYWLGDLAMSEEHVLEEHLFNCGACSTRLEELAALGAGIRILARRGEVNAVVTVEFINKLKAQGARIREYRMRPGQSVNCSIAPDEDLAVAHLEAPLVGVSRLDLVFDFAEGGLPQQRLSDVAFNGDRGEIVLAPRAADLRALGDAVQRVRLVSVTEAGDRLLGEYTFRHTPYR